MSISPTGDHLIFILSQPRAGSTLLQYILSGHPQVGAMPEPWVMLHPVYARRHTGITTEYFFNRYRVALDEFLQHFPEGEALHDEAIRAYALTLYNRACERLGTSFFVDKTPSYTLIIPELYRIFPHASFIFLLRNPLAVLRSVLQTWVRDDFTRLAKHRYSLLGAPRHLIEGMALLGERSVIVHYEALVEHPHATVANLCASLGLEFSPSMLEYRSQLPSAAAMGDPTGVYQHRRPEKHSLEAWRALGDTRQTRHFALAYLDALGRKTLRSLGYDAQALREAIESRPAPSGKVVIRWKRAIASDKTRRERLRLLWYESRRRGAWLSFPKKVAKIFLDMP